MLRRPKTFEDVCRECFFQAFENEIHETITSSCMFKQGERIAVAASGGKDSTVLAHVGLFGLNNDAVHGLSLRTIA